MVYQIPAVVLNEKQFRHKFAALLREPLLPNNDYRLRSPEYRHELPLPEEALLALVLFANLLQMLFGNDTLRPLCEVPYMSLMIDCS